MVFGDALVLVLALWLAFLSDMLHVGGFEVMPFLGLLAVSLPVWLAVLHIGVSDVRRPTMTGWTVRIVAGALLAMLSEMLLYSGGFAPASARIPILHAELTACLLLVTRFAARRSVYAPGYALAGTQRILLVGFARQARDYAERLQQSIGRRVDVVGFLHAEGDGMADLASLRTLDELLGAHPSEVATGKHDFAVLGSVSGLRRILIEQSIDQVVFCCDEAEFASHLATCEEMGVEAVYLPRVTGKGIAHATVEDHLGLPSVRYTTTPRQRGQLALKQAIDSTLSGLAVLLLLPLFALVALAVRLDSRGPVFFRQTRVTVRGRHFACLKFRTMYVDAEARLEELWAKNEMQGPVFKMRDDPRVTRVGRWLRKFSLDELPQLFNVLRGEMSLVGPRPPLPAEVARYEPWHRRRLSVKPGLTCIWQVSGRNDVDFDNWMKLDLEYIDRWSLSLDLKLILKTIPAVVRGTGC